MLPPEKKPILLFELGHLQVFCYQTIEEWTKRLAPSEVYWQKKGETNVYGPFKNEYLAVEHYSNHIKPQELLPANVIQVDFRAKKRVK